MDETVGMSMLSLQSVQQDRGRGRRIFKTQHKVLPKSHDNALGMQVEHKQCDIYVDEVVDDVKSGNINIGAASMVNKEVGVYKQFVYKQSGRPE